MNHAIGSESPESKGRKPAGRAADAFRMGQESRDAHVPGEKPREEKEKRKERELVGVARDIFGRQTHITYIDLCEQLQQVLDIKERTAKNYIPFHAGERNHPERPGKPELFYDRSHLISIGGSLCI